MKGGMEKRTPVEAALSTLVHAACFVETAVGGDLDLDPLLLALLRKIPDAEKGWPAAQRLRWFRTFAMNVSQIYDGEAMGPVELKIRIGRGRQLRRPLVDYSF
jgi:hypothetical protein